MKDFFKLKEAITAADKKPENYVDPRTGKTKTRMVPTMKMTEQAAQVTVGDYTTKHFDICPSAVALYSDIAGKTEMNHLVVETMMLHDIFFRLEKQAIAMGYIDEEELDKAQHYADMIMDNADQMGLLDEHDYIENVHMEKFRDLSEIEMEDEENDDEDEEEDDEDEMNEKTLTPAELKKREEIAKAIKRENPNMPMAKKMAIATATAKKVAEEANLNEISRDLATRAAQGFADKADAAHTKKDYAGFKKGEAARKMAIAKVQGRAKVSAVARRVEETELDEAVEVSHDRYMRSHGKKASGGEGNWMFTHKRMGDANVNNPKEVHSARGKFSDAKKSAQQWAKKHGHSTVYVMEEVEQIDEISADLAHDVYKKRMAQAKAHVQQDNYSAARTQKESVELEEGISNLSHARLKFHATKGVPHGSYSNKEIKDEHNRRMRTEPDYVKAKASMSEEVEQIDEIAKEYYAVHRAASLSGAQMKGAAPGDQPSFHKTEADAINHLNKKYKKVRDGVWKDSKGQFFFHKKHSSVKEEVEQIDELKRSTLSSYLKKSMKSKDKADGRSFKDTVLGKPPRDEKTFTKRRRGINTAINKLSGSYVARVIPKEEVEQIDELSKNTLRSYADKAGTSRIDLTKKANVHIGKAYKSMGHADRSKDPNKAAKHREDQKKYFAAANPLVIKARNRSEYERKARAKLGEDQQIDEISADLAHDVYKKRMAQAKAHVQQDNYSAARKAEKKAGDTSLRMIKKILKRPS